MAPRIWLWHREYAEYLHTSRVLYHKYMFLSLIPYLRHICGEVRSDENRLHALNWQRLAYDELGCRCDMSESSIFLLHKESFACVVVPEKRAAVGGHRMTAY